MYAWRLQLDFNHYQHLFSSLDLDYDIFVFCCSCGSESIMLSHKGEVCSYSCKECGNKSFLNANNAIEHPFYFFSQYEEKKEIIEEEFVVDEFADMQIMCGYHYNFSFEYDTIKILPNKVVLSYGFRVPYDIDYVRQKVFYKIEPVYTFGFNNKNEIIYEYSIAKDKSIFTNLAKKLQKTLPNYAKDLNIPSDIPQKITLSVAKFFFSYRNLKEFEFYYFDNAEFFNKPRITIDKAFEIIRNNMKAKSVKKVIYTSYLRQIENSKKYVWKIEYNLTRDIQDINILCQLIKKMQDFRYALYSGVNLSNFIALYQYFLKVRDEKSLVNFFDSFIKESFELGVDTLNEFIFAKNFNILDQLTKPKSNLLQLHNQLLRLNNQKRCGDLEQLHFVYLKEAKRYEMEIDSYTVVLPKSAKELFEWGEQLHNCLASYVNKVRFYHVMIFGFKVLGFDEIDFAVEYSKTDGIVQASSKYNASLNKHQKQALSQWIHRVQQLEGYSVLVTTQSDSY